MKKKVLLIADNYDEKGGGAEKVFFTVKRDLEKRGFDVYGLGFSTYNKATKKERVIKETNSLVMRHLNRLFYNPRKYRQIRSFVKKVNPDVIHIHNINKYTISLLKALKGYKVVYSVHDYGIVCPTKWNVHSDFSVCKTGLRTSCLWEHKRDYNILVYLSLLYFFYKRNKLIKKLVSHYTTSTPVLKKYLVMNQFTPVTVIPDPIFPSKVPKEQFEKIKKNHFFFAAHLEENKGVRRVVEEFILASKKKKGLYLTIAGEGPLKEEMIKKVKEHGLEKQVSFVGWVKLPEYYRNHSALIAPSLWMDNNPIIVQEMMLYARPVIGSNRGGMLYSIKDKETGFNVDPMKKGAIAKRILELTDIRKVKKMGRAAQKRIQKINKAKVTYSDIY